MGRQSFFLNALLFLVVLLKGIGGVPGSPQCLFAAPIPVTTEVKHKPIKYFIPGHRIALEAKVTDESGVKLVRCYFKADEQAEHVFVPMTMTDGQEYRAILPAPADYAQKIRYLFLVVNVNQQVVKTQAFLMEKAADVTDPPAWQETSTTDELPVYTELSQPPETVPGFSDSVKTDAVESSLRFGMVAGIYSSSATASTGAAAATSGGSITATAGISTTVVVATAVGLAAGAGAIAADGGGGGGGDDEVNPNASISWGDANVPPSNSFRAIFCDEDLGTASGRRTKTGLRVGSFDLTIRAVSVSGDFGNYLIDLGGGAYFREGGIQREGELLEGESVVFRIVVPETGDARVEW